MKQTDSSLPPSSTGDLRVFVVEDSMLVRELLIDNLAQIPGVAVIGFADSEDDALLRLHTLACDVLVLDIELKQGNGLSLLRNLRQHQRQMDSLKIIFSNNVSEPYRRLGEQLGVSHFFDKASEFFTLYSLIERMGTCPSSR